MGVLHWFYELASRYCPQIVFQGKDKHVLLVAVKGWPGELIPNRFLQQSYDTVRGAFFTDTSGPLH